MDCSVSGEVAREGDLMLGSAGLGPVPMSQMFSWPPKSAGAVGQTRALGGRQDTARRMALRAQQQGWGDGGLVHPS